MFDLKFCVKANKGNLRVGKVFEASELPFLIGL